MTACDASRPALIVVDNLPYDPTILHGLTDPEIGIAPKPSRLSEAPLLGFAAHRGLPYGVATEGRGLVNNLCPIRSQEDAFTGLGSKQELGLHVDNALQRRLARDTSPDGLGLIGVVGEPGGGPRTMVADARLARARIGAGDEALLRDPERFFVRLPKRWRRDGSPDGRLAPIISGKGAQESYCFAFYGDMVEARDRLAAKALSAFREAPEEATEDLRIEPGVIALIDNRIAARGRTTFRSTFSETGAPYRWVQRTFWTGSYARFEGWRQDVSGVFRSPADLLADI